MQTASAAVKLSGRSPHAIAPVGSAYRFIFNPALIRSSRRRISFRRCAVFLLRSILSSGPLHVARASVRRCHTRASRVSNASRYFWRSSASANTTQCLRDGFGEFAAALGPHRCRAVAQIVPPCFSIVGKISVTQANNDAPAIDGHARRLVAELFPFVVLLKILSTLCGCSPFYLFGHDPSSAFS